MTVLAPRILAALEEIVGAAQVRADADSRAVYARDRTSSWPAQAGAVVLPATVEQVQAIVRLANAEGLAIVPSGGRTGLSGGAVASAGELVLALDRMRKIGDFDPIDRSVRVEAGVVTAELQQWAQAQGLFYPVDFAASGSSQIGGNIATNAGGIKVIRYGMTRDWVRGLKVVTGDGRLLDLNQGLLKNNAGYDFRHLFIGSEGTLGVIVEATLGLIRPPQALSVLLLAVPSMEAVMKVLHHFQQRIDLTAFEFFSEAALQKVMEEMKLPRPLGEAADFYALLEFEQPDEGVAEKVMGLFEDCVEQGWVLDGVISQSIEQQRNLWRLREDISESIARYTPYKNDIAVRVSRTPAFLAELSELVAVQHPDFEIIWFGHIGDGNLHLNILKPATLSGKEFFARCHRLSEQVFEVVRKYEGTVSAEHGVGLLKKDHLHYSRSADELALMQAVKKVFDPQGIMNPGKIFDLVPG